MSRFNLGLLGMFGALLVLMGLLAYFLVSESIRTSPEAAGTPSVTAQTPDEVLKETSTPTPESAHKGSAFAHLFESGHPSNRIPGPWGLAATAAKVAFSFALAGFLAALLAFRPRRLASPTQRNPYVAQTQILLGVVAAAMMMIVGDSAARAFGIFAAASLVRFRTNIRDPKEITVLLICLGVGLAAGVGRWDMAVVLTLFVLIALWILESFEQSQVFRSMELTVKSRNTPKTQEILQKILSRHGFTFELREVDRNDEEDPLGKLVYAVDLGARVSTDRLTQEILGSDTENIDTVEWDQKKSTTYLYR